VQYYRGSSTVKTLVTLISNRVSGRYYVAMFTPSCYLVENHTRAESLCYWEDLRYTMATFAAPLVGTGNAFHFRDYRNFFCPPLISSILECGKFPIPGTVCFTRRDGRLPLRPNSQGSKDLTWNSNSLNLVQIGKSKPTSSITVSTRFVHHQAQDPSRSVTKSGRTAFACQLEDDKNSVAVRNCTWARAICFLSD